MNQSNNSHSPAPVPESSSATSSTHQSKMLGRSSTTRSVYNPSSGNVVQEREDICKSMKDEMVCCSIQDFIQYYLPFLPSKPQISDGITHLVKKGELQGTSSGLIWTKFSEPPSKKPGREKVVFDPLEDIAQKLGEIALPGRHASFGLRCLGDSTTSSEIAGSSHKIDGFIGPTSRISEKSVATSDVAVSCEFKKHNSYADTLDNRKKVLSSANHCMNNDPRRMHMYGITIEDTSVSVWYFSRSHSCVSAPFDFTKDITEFVTILLAFLFAEEKEIGYDNTVKRHYDGDGKVFYVYKVEGRHFKTVSSISEYRSRCITSRATRVWKVIEVDSIDHSRPLKGSPMVLKDFWVDEGSPSEKEIQEAIFESLKEFAPKFLQQGAKPDHFVGLSSGTREQLLECLNSGTYRDYFLQIAAAEKGAVSKAVVPSKTLAPDLFDPVSNAIKPAKVSMSGPSQSRYPFDTGSGGKLGQTIEPGRPFKPKQQHRLVFSEVCVTFHNINDLETAISIMMDGVFALQLMFLAGWVHRDISSGNLLCYQAANETPRGKLSDLEYAKKFVFKNDQSTHSDPKTGTVFFMAVEVQMQSVVHHKGGGLDPPPLIHHYEHDIESFFWLFLWTLTARVRFAPSQAWANNYFQPGKNCPSWRSGAIFNPDHFFNELTFSRIHPSLSDTRKPVATLWRELVMGYKNRLYNLSDIKSYSSLYEAVYEALNACADVVRALGTEVLSMVVVDTQAPSSLVIEGATRTKPSAPGSANNSPYRSRKSSLAPSLHSNSMMVD